MTHHLPTQKANPPSNAPTPHGTPCETRAGKNQPVGANRSWRVLTGIIVGMMAFLQRASMVKRMGMEMKSGNVSIRKGGLISRQRMSMGLNWSLFLP